MKKAALGRGFDGLIPIGFDVQATATPGESIKKIALSDIVQNPDQPRKTFDDESISELAQSIKQYGIIQPLVVTPFKKSYRIVAGERRFRAAKKAGLDKVPAIVRNHKELEELEIALVENVQRVDLSPIETAVSLLRLRDQFSLSTKQIAQKLGKAETTVSNIIRLLNLPKEAIEKLQKNEITEGHARALLSIKTDEKAQLDLLNKIITQNLSVRESETQAKLAKHSENNKNFVPKELEATYDTVKNVYGKKLRLQQKKRGGRLSIDYESTEELKKLLNRFI